MNTSQRSFVALAFLGFLVVPLAGQTPPTARPSLAPGQTNQVPKWSDFGLVVQDLNSGVTPTQLAQSILSGSGVTISNVQFSGLGVSGGTFSTTDASVLGFTSGIVLSSGDVNSVVGPNLADDTSTSTGLGSDPDLAALIPGFSVNDACVLEFDFTTAALAVGQTGAVSFNFVFSSEEYNEWVNTAYNDVFGFFLNGQNIALLQDLVTPVSIDNVNSGNPFVVGGGMNSNQFRNNDLNDGGGSIDTEMDGLTVVLTAFGNITGPGPHHIKLAIADAGDTVLDSNVFIQGSSLVASSTPTCIAPTPTSPVNVTAQNPISWEVRAVANHGGSGVSVTLSNSSVTFDANFGGNPVAIASPVNYAPALPLTGQPASTIVTWTPGLLDVGTWTFNYHLVDDIGQAEDCSVQVNVLPTMVSGPGVIAPTPANDVETAVFLPTTWQIHAVSGAGFGGDITIQSVSVEFEANFVGGAVAVPSPVNHYPNFPVTGQPAIVSVSWVPPLNAVGQWDFDYHMIDSFGQVLDFSLTVNVRDAIFALGLAPTMIPLGSPGADVLRVDPLLLFSIAEGAEPEIFVPNNPVLLGLDVYAQAILVNPARFPLDPIKSSETLRFCIGSTTTIFAPGNGLELLPDGISELDEILPFTFSVL